MRCWAAMILAMGSVAATVPAFAASQTDFDSAYAAAAAAEADAGKALNQWTSTEDTLKAAKKAADVKDFGQATALAGLARAMAIQSIAQAKEQRDAWRDAVIR